MHPAFEVLFLTLVSFYLFIEITLHSVFFIIKESSVKNHKIKGISVIIASKNEASNLEKNLSFVLKQNYSKFEVIVVDDHSTDDTLNIIQRYKTKYSNLKYFKLNKNTESSKKQTLAYGIEKAQFENLIFTDADCKPLTDNWLSTFQAYLKNKDSIILGYSPYRKEKGWLNKLIRFETFQTAINYFSMAKIGQAYMGVGRNLGYTKTIFKTLDGFKSHFKIASGDDDLLIKSASNRFPIEICLNPNTFVETQPERTITDWVNQKRRHITTANHYKLKHQLFLGFQFIIRFLFWFFLIPFSLISLMYFKIYPILIVLFTLLIKLIICKSNFKKLKVMDLWFKSYMLEFLLICLHLYIFSLNLISPKRDW